MTTEITSAKDNRPRMQGSPKIIGEENKEREAPGAAPKTRSGMAAYFAVGLY